MKQLTLDTAKQKHPAALYSFMHIVHPTQAMDAFLNNPARNPVFEYPKTLNLARAQKRLEQLRADVQDTQDGEVRAFLQHRIRETELLCMFVELRQTSVLDAQLATYRVGMESLYGPFNGQYFDGVLTYLHTLAQERNDRAALDALKSIGWKPTVLWTPDTALFAKYRAMLRRHLPGLFKSAANQTDIVAAAQHALDDAGLAANGWRVRMAAHATNVSVSRHGKTINVGEHYQPASPFRLQQIIAHEVYGHARRFSISGHAASSKEEEGVAILCEQLLARRFIYKRMLRYVALSLAWGADGTPRDFVHTYQLMLPIVRLATGKRGASARQIAFKETLRAFRGGNPSVPGMILLKDKVYLESNLMVWQYLADNMLNETEFGQIIDGQSLILERSAK